MPVRPTLPCPRFRRSRAAGLVVVAAATVASLTGVSPASAAVNVAPTVTAGPTAARVVEQVGATAGPVAGAPVVVDPAIQVDDPEDGTLGAATASLTAGNEPGDVLSIDPTALPAGATVDPASGSGATLTFAFAPAVTEVAVLGVLSQVTFALDAADDTPSTADRTVTFTATDDGSAVGDPGHDLTGSATQTVHVEDRNDPPVVSGPPPSTPIALVGEQDNGGASTPFPATNHVGGLTGTVTDVNLTLSGFTTGEIGNYVALLVSPDGRTVMPFGHSCSGAVNGIDITLDDEAGNFFGFPCQTGTYQPSNGHSGYTPPGAPGEPYATQLSAFDGAPANGTWQLFVWNHNGFGQGPGTLGGWSITITTTGSPATTFGGSQGTISFAEGSPPVVVGTGLTVSEPEGDQIASLVVTLANAKDGDVLSGPAGHEGVYDAAAGTLTFDESAAPLSAADAQALLRQVTFGNPRHNPDNTDRHLSFVATDDAGATSDPSERTVTVTDVNEAPLLVAGGTPARFVEQVNNTPRPPVVVDPAITVDDSYDSPFKSASATLTAGTDPGDTLSVDPASLPAGASVVPASGSGASLVLAFAPSVTKADVQAVLRSVGFALAPGNNTPNLVDRTVTFSVTDDGASANDPGDDATASATQTVSVEERNDAPVVNVAPLGTTIGGGTSPSRYGTYYLFSQPFQVTAADLAQSPTGQITLGQVPPGVASGNVYQESAGFGSQICTPGTCTSGAEVTASFNGPGTYEIYFDNAQSGDVLGDSLLTFGAAGAATTSTAYVAGDPAVTVAPALTVRDAEGDHLTSLVATLTGAKPGDVLSGPAGDEGVYDDAAHTLTFDESAAPLTAAQAQALLRQVTFVNTTANPGTTARVVRFVVTDDGGSAQTNPADPDRDSDLASGTDDERTVDVSGGSDNVAPSVDASPSGTAAAWTETSGDFTAGVVPVSPVAGDPAPVAVAPELTITDDGDAFASAVVTLTNAQDGDVLSGPTGDEGVYDAAAGTLTFSAARGNLTTAELQALLRQVTFANTTHTPDETDRAVTFVVTDDGGEDSASGGDSEQTVTVDAVDDAPVVAPGPDSATFDEAIDGAAAAPVVVDPAVTVDDADNGTYTAAYAELTAGSQTGDRLAVDPATLPAGTTVTPASGKGARLDFTFAPSASRADVQGVLRSVTFALDPADDAPSTADRTVTFGVTDDGASADDAGSNLSASATQVVAVRAHNDAPVVDANSAGASAVTVPGGSSFALFGSFQFYVKSFEVTSAQVRPGTQVSVHFSTVPTSPTFYVLLQYTFSPTSTTSVAVCGLSIGLPACEAGTTYQVAFDPAYPPYPNPYWYLQAADPDGGPFDIGDAEVGFTTPTRFDEAVDDYDATTVPISPVALTATPVAVAPDLGIDDDGDAFSSAVVTLTNPKAGDELADPTGTSTGGYDAASGTLSFDFSGNPVSRADLESLLRQVTYANTTHSPDETDRTVKFVVTDAGGIDPTVEPAADSDAASGTQDERTVKVVEHNDRPLVLTGADPAQFVEGQDAPSVPVAVDPALRLDDVDTDTLQSATVRLLDDPNSGDAAEAADVLALPDTPGYASSYDGSTHTLTITRSQPGSYALAAWRDVLRSVTFTNDYDNLSPNPRLAIFVVDDGESDNASSTPVTQTIDVAAVNDTPVVTSSAGTVTYQEPTPDNSTPAPVVVDPALTVVDADGLLHTATVRILEPAFRPFEDALEFDGDPAVTGDITATYDAATGVLTLTSLDLNGQPDDVWQAALRRVTYADVALVHPTEGTRTVRFRVADDAGASDTAERDVQVLRADRQVAHDDAYATQEDHQLVVDAPGVLGNDSDLTATGLSAALVSPPSHGQVGVRPNGGFTYTPDADYTGSESFTYGVNGATTGSGTAVVTLDVTPVADAPVADDEAYTTAEDTDLSDNVLDAGDTDADAGETATLSAQLLAGPAHGTITSFADGAFTYRPDHDFNGRDSFTYQVTDATGLHSAPATAVITVTPVADVPVAVGDVATTPRDTPVDVDVLVNDHEVDGGTPTITGLTQPDHGTTAVVAGKVRYTPAAGFEGTDSFTYTMTSASGTSAPATVLVNVTKGPDRAPVAGDDNYFATEDTRLEVDAPGVLANDHDPDGDTISVVSHSGPTKGSVGFSPDGSFSYVPNADANGVDSFTYVVTDGTLSATGHVTIRIAAVDDTPVAADKTATVAEDTTLQGTGLTAGVIDVDSSTFTASKASGAEHGSVTVHPDGTYTYVPEHDFAGTDSFTYTVKDDTSVSAPATVTITVTPVNDAPVAADDQVSVLEDSAETAIDVLANDVDVDGDALSATKLPGSGPDHGTLTAAFGYTPDADFTGTDTFGYTVSDGHGGTDTATVSIVVRSTVDAPVANDDDYDAVEDTVLVVPAPGVRDNDTDADGDTVVVVPQVTTTAKGTLNLHANGGFTFTPAANATGAAAYTYAVDGGDTATITITVVPVNDPPVAVGDSVTTPEDTTLSGGPSVLANDADVEGSPLTAALVSTTGHGTLALAADGTFTYAPQANFNGVDSFTYRASDGDAFSVPVTVTITVAPVNDPPVGTADAYGTDQGVGLFVPTGAGVLGNDVDVDGDALTAVLGTDVQHGQLTLSADGSFTYVPGPGFWGSDSFTYRVSDGTATSAPITVTLTVRHVDQTQPVPVFISSGPAEGSTSNADAFEFEGRPGDTVECRFDQGVYVPCTSPLSVALLPDGPHTLRLRQTDAAGRVSPENLRTWTRDTTAPAAPRIVTAPAATGASHAVRIQIDPVEGTKPVCSLDGSAVPAPTCGITTDLTVATGSHRFQVHLVDAAGNVGPDATAPFTVTGAPTLALKVRKATGNAVRVTCAVTVGQLRTCSVVAYLVGSNGKHGQRVGSGSVRATGGQKGRVKVYLNALGRQVLGGAPVKVVYVAKARITGQAGSLVDEVTRLS